MQRTASFTVVLVIGMAIGFLLGYLWSNSTIGRVPAAEPALSNVVSVQNGGTATAQDYGTYMGQSMIPSRVNDDNRETDWAGMRMPAWCQVEFNREYTIRRIRCVANYHTQTYELQLSQDGHEWTTVAAHTTPNNKPSGESEGHDDFAIDIAPTPARYARVVVTATDAPRSHIYQAIISELEAWGH